MIIELGIISNLSIPNLILLIDSDSYRFPVLIPIQCGLKKNQTFRYEMYLFCLFLQKN